MGCIYEAVNARLQAIKHDVDSLCIDIADGSLNDKSLDSISGFEQVILDFVKGCGYGNAHLANIEHHVMPMHLGVKVPVEEIIALLCEKKLLRKDWYESRGRYLYFPG
jgi:hypothetical protein